MERPLIPRASWWLIEVAAWALGLAVLYRLLAGIVLNPQFWRGNLAVIRPSHLWLLENQLLAAALLLAALYLLGCYLPQAWEGLIAWPVGAAGWAVALSLLPRSLPAIWPASRIAPWLVWLAVAAAVATWLWRRVRMARWQRLAGGHGYAWILEWAAERPFAARLAAWRALRVLGWRG